MLQPNKGGHLVKAITVLQNHRVASALEDEIGPRKNVRSAQEAMSLRYHFVRIDSSVRAKSLKVLLHDLKLA